MSATEAIDCGNTNMMFYEDRLSTFENWSKQINPDKYRLAKAGFYYKGQVDVVTCFSCNITVNDWETNDNPWEEHYKTLVV